MERVQMETPTKYSIARQKRLQEKRQKRLEEQLSKNTNNKTMNNENIQLFSGQVLNAMPGQMVDEKQINKKFYLIERPCQRIDELGSHEYYAGYDTTYCLDTYTRDVYEAKKI